MTKNVNDFPGENPGDGRPRRAAQALNQGRPPRNPWKDSSSPHVSPADCVSVSLNASRQVAASSKSLPRPSEGCATGILWLAPETPLFLCDDHVTEYADLRFARSTSAGPDDVDIAREAAYGILFEERPGCVECEHPGTVERWSP